jgi:hypothetical protein
VARDAVGERDRQNLGRRTPAAGWQRLPDPRRPDVRVRPGRPHARRRHQKRRRLPLGCPERKPARSAAGPPRKHVRAARPRVQSRRRAPGDHPWERSLALGCPPPATGRRNVARRTELSSPAAVETKERDCEICGETTQISFSPDGTRLFLAGFSEISAWDTRHRTKRLALFGHGDQGISISPDGTIALAGYSEDSLRAHISLWDASAGKQLGPQLTFGAHYDNVGSVAISPTGRTFAAGGDRGLLRFWDGIIWRNYDDLRESICRTVLGNLTRDEWRKFGPTEPYHATCSWEARPGPAGDAPPAHLL